MEIPGEVLAGAGTILAAIGTAITVWWRWSTGRVDSAEARCDKSQESFLAALREHGDKVRDGMRQLGVDHKEAVQKVVEAHHEDRKEWVAALTALRGNGNGTTPKGSVAT